MSLADHRGAAFYFRALMQASADEIHRGKRKGVTVRYPTADPKRTVMPNWRLWRIGVVRKRA